MVEKKSNNYGIVAAVILFVALIIGNYFQYQLSPLAPRLMETMGLTPGQFSSAFSAPMIPSIFLGIVAGVLADKFGVKNVAAVGLAVTAIGLCVRPFTYDYLTLFVSMILGGVGVSFLNANMSKIVGGWFPPEKVGPIVGLTMVGSTIGMTLGSATTALLPSVKVAFWISGIGSVVVLIIWVLFMKDGTLNQEAAVPQESVMDSVRVVLKSKNIWLVGFCLMCIMGCNVALASFLPTALQSRGISESTAGVLSSVITIGSLIGTFIGPTIVAKAGRMKPLLMVLGGDDSSGRRFWLVAADTRCNRAVGSGRLWHGHTDSGIYVLSGHAAGDWAGLRGKRRWCNHDSGTPGSSRASHLCNYAGCGFQLFTLFYDNRGLDACDGGDCYPASGAK